jgi:hypothetical protein
MKEGKVQSKKIKELEDAGYYVIKLMKTNKNGIPDLLAIPRGSDVEFFEIKTSIGKLSTLQEFRISELKRHELKVNVYYEEKN